MKAFIAKKKQQAEKLAAPFKTKQNKGFIEVLPNKIFPKGAYITWAIGHLFSLATPEVYDPKYKKWVLEDLPILPSEFKYTLDKSKAKQFAAIKEILKKSSEIILGTDPGCEGEAIGRIIIQMSGVKKPVKRLWTTSLTTAAVTKAFENLLPGDQKLPLYYEARARACADWLVGINTSRAYSILLSQQGKKEAFSTGRVQTPLLAFILKREKEIESFVSTPFWEVYADFHFNGDALRGKWFKNDIERLDNKHQAEALTDYCKGKDVTITDITNEKKEFNPPLLHSLSTLQVVANRRYKLSPDKVLEICQSLYMKEHISYPRTDSQFVTEEEAMAFPNILDRIMNLKQYQTFFPLPNSSLIGNKRYVNSSKVTDHYAIIPTEQVPDIEKLSNDERKIYDLIVRSLIAAHYPKAVINYTRIISLVDGKFTFKSNGKQQIEERWQKIIALAEKEEDTVLPILIKGVAGVVPNTELKEGKTVPPKRFTEGELITLMKGAGKLIEEEDAEYKEVLNNTEGLGTEATRASIIETLKVRDYISVSKNIVTPTKKDERSLKQLGRHRS